MGAQFDEEFGLQRPGQPVRERQMAAPGAGCLQRERRKLSRFQQTVGEAIHAVFSAQRDVVHGDACQSACYTGWFRFKKQG